MDRNKTVEVLGFYDQHLATIYNVESYPISDYGRTTYTTDEMVRHLRWMCVTAVRFDDLKMSRWLGYIQGELRALGVFSIAQMRAHGRS